MRNEFNHTVLTVEGHRLKAVLSLLLRVTTVELALSRQVRHDVRERIRIEENRDVFQQASAYRIRKTRKDFTHREFSSAAVKGIGRPQIVVCGVDVKQRTSVRQNRIDTRHFITERTVEVKRSAGAD